MVDSDESLTAGKRLRDDNSGGEKCELPSKRPRSKSPEPVEPVDSQQDVLVQVTNGSTVSSEEQTDTAKVDDEVKNGEAEATEEDTKINIVVEDPPEVNTEEVKPVEKNKEDVKKEEDQRVEKDDVVKKEDVLNKGEEDEPLEDKSNDSEVVDGLELSVECASDKEASSSESEKETDTSQPRPKTIIVKAKPNDSELEVSSSEAEKSDNDEKVAENDSTDKKRIGKRKSFAKASSSRSEDSLESNSDDEDYSPRTKKKLKKTVTPKKATPQKTKAKKERESKKKPVTDSEDEKSESQDEEMNLADRAKKISDKSLKKTSEENKSDSESKDGDDSMDDSDDKNKKNGKQKSKNSNPHDNKTIKKLKKYITAAGIRLKYDSIWSDCRTNNQRIDRLRKALEEHGMKGRPTLVKCKKLKAKNATKKEVAELSTSNIISEGRITRARRIEATKAGLGMPPKHRETRNLFKRLQPVLDSDTE